MSVKRIPAAEARARFRNVVQAVRARGERIEITRYGRVLAGIVPVRDLKLLRDCEGESSRRAARRR
jgi:prevent-host-death family protein